MTNPIVREQFPAFTTQFEGRVATMYLDVKGLVTIGVGCLIDTPDGAARLPFVNANGTVVPPSEIVAAWHNVKNHQNLSKLHYRYAVPYNNGLHLPEAAIDDLLRERLDQNDAIFARTFPEWATFPVEALMAIHSMGWAMGAGFPAKWPAFSAAVRRRDWMSAAQCCKIREEGNPGIVPRNKANKRLFEAAGAPPAGITDDDRARAEYLTTVWLDKEAHGENESTESNA